MVGSREQLYKTIVSDPINTLQNDNSFSREDYTKHLISKGGGLNSPLHHSFEEKEGAPDPLHPYLDTGLGKTIILLFIYNLYMHINVPALLPKIKIAILFLFYMHI